MGNSFCAASRIFEKPVEGESRIGPGMILGWERMNRYRTY